MAKLPVNPLAWLEPDRRWLYLSLLVLTHRRLTDSRLAVTRHVLLIDLEIHDDPRQGAGTWLFPNEEPLLDLLGEQLQNIGAAAGSSRSEWHRATLDANLRRAGTRM